MYVSRDEMYVSRDFFANTVFIKMHILKMFIGERVCAPRAKSEQLLLVCQLLHSTEMVHFLQILYNIP